MKVKFWGTRGSIAVPGKDTTTYGGNTTCLEMTLESGRKIVIDAGTGIRPLGQHLLADSEKIERAKNLLEYCKLDTLAMVEIHKALLQQIDT